MSYFYYYDENGKVKAVEQIAVDNGILIKTIFRGADDPECDISGFERVESNAVIDEEVLKNCELTIVDGVPTPIS